MARPPAWLIGAKALLIGLLLTGALFPSVGGFEGKGMAFRLPIFAFPAVIIPLLRLRRRATGPWPVALDAGLTLPFLLDTAGNAVGLYDHWVPTDDVLHVLNWFLLFGGVTVFLFDAATRGHVVPRWLVWLAGAGAGAWAIIGWEAAEYAVMKAGVGGLSLTYGDTLGDLLGSSTGGAIGAWCALRWLRPTPAG